ncbi:MAG TPA: MBL fold metallo-hydrolase [Chloroflexota bacterium]|nr:MBL fold metallo-hydrolase [Chloroflexota bacterium]
MRLTDEVYLVGGGPSFAFGLSGDPDCHVYLINGGTELALVDCGAAEGDSFERITATIREEGLDLDRLRYLLVTHAHIDHVGGAARFREGLGLQVLVARAAAPYLRSGDEHATSLDVAKKAGFYRADYRFAPCAVDRELVEGDRISVGDLTLDVYETPGHADPHLSFLLAGRRRRYLFAGDAVFHGGGTLLQYTHDCSMQSSGASIEKLAGLEFDALLPGHQAITLSGGTRHVQMAATAFFQQLLPKSLV